MLDRRVVVAGLLASLLVAGALVVPQVFSADEALEATALAGPIGNAIEAGVSPTIAGLLPTSEAYQRARAVADGLQAGVPASAPSLSSSQLSDVTAIAAGAARGALAVAPNTLTSAADKGALSALAEGYMSGALDEIAKAPSSARAAIDGAATEGVFAGAMGAIFSDAPALPPADLEEFGVVLASDLFDGLDEQGAALAAIGGSPALSDITTFTTGFVRAELAGSSSDAPVDAIATFAAGGIDGMVAGLVTSFPQGAPAPAREDLERWFDALAEGHAGSPPWEEPASLPLLFAWADALGAGGVNGVAQARENLTGAVSPGASEEIAALAAGLSEGGATYLQALPGYQPQIEDDIRAYADGLTGPGLACILTVAHPPSDPDAVAAYAEGLTAGLADLAGASTAALGLTEAWLAGLSSAITDLPMSDGTQASILENFTAGATTRLTTRMENLTRVAGASDADAAFITEAATAIATGATGLVGAAPLSDPELAQAFGDGIASGFLETRNPQALFDDTEGLDAAIGTWFSEGVEGGVGLIGAIAAAGAAPYDSVRAFGEVIGATPAGWVANKGNDLTDETGYGIADAEWLQTFTQTAIEDLAGSFHLDPTDPKPKQTLDAMDEYATTVLGAAVPSVKLKQVIANLQSGDVHDHAKAFAHYLLEPTNWVERHPDLGTLRAGKAAALTILDNAQAIERFKDADYAPAAIAYLMAMGEGLPQDPGEYTEAWVQGVMLAVEELPEDAVEDDISARIQWVKTASAVVGPIRKNVTQTQYEATVRFAFGAAEWALGARDHVPEADELETALAVWAEGTIAPALEHLPPAMSQDEEDAVVAYVTGIAQAAGAFPTDLLLDPPTQEALLAYLAGITSGVDTIPDETDAFLCANKVDSACPEDDNGGGTGCTEPPCEEEPPAACADDVCSFANYTERLQLWANGITTAGLEGYQPDTAPTQAGIALVGEWAFLVLGGHGLCPATEDAQLDCGPRAPPLVFADESSERILLTTQLVGDGLHALVTYEPDPAHPPPLDAENDPILGWAAGATAAITAFVADDHSVTPEGGDAPEEPTFPSTDGSPYELFDAWTDAVWDATSTLPSDAIGALPPYPGFDGGLADAEYLLADVVLQGGGRAIFEDEGALKKYAREPVPDASLDAWAAGLSAGAQQTLLDPSAADAQLVLDWYAGLANGGVGAIVAAGSGIRDEQAPALAGYAEALATSFAPPAPPDSYTLAKLTAPDDGSEEPPADDGGGSGDDGAEGPGASAFEDYRTNLQAHAEGMAAAALAAPRDLTKLQAYLDALVAAATDLPPVTPGEGYPARLAAWSQAETSAALAAPPTSPDRIGPDPDLALALAYVQAFAASSPWSLDEATDGADAWAAAAIAGALGTPCPAPDESACAALGTTLGEALGQGIPQAARELPTPDAGDATAFVAALLEGAAPEIDGVPSSDAIAILAGIAAGLSPAGVGDPDAQAIAALVARTLASDDEPVPGIDLRRAAIEMADALQRSDPSQWAAIASGTVALLASGADDPAATQQALTDHLTTTKTGSPSPVVSATDGARTATGAQLDGDAVLDGLKSITVHVYPGASSPLASTWELWWSPTDPTGATATKVAMTGSEGAFSATLAPGALAGLARAAMVQFVVAETSAGKTTLHANGADPFAFVPDRDAPTASIAASSLAGVHIGVSWTGQDGDSAVKSYHVESRDGGGAWATWLDSTHETGATFSGVPGHAFSFRVTAIDPVGHASEASVTAPVSVPTDAAPDQAPLLTLLAPVAGSVFGRSIPVELDASDPDGTQPMVKVCLRKEGATVDLACPYEGKPNGIAIDAARMADGKYRLHAIATDGTLSTEVTSGAFALDRAPPMFRGAGGDAVSAGVLLTASLDKDATRVRADVGGHEVALADDGQGADARAADGVWSALTTLPPGEFPVTFRATDANGNEATLAKTIVVPKPQAAVPPGSKPGATPTPSAPPTTPTPAPPVHDAPAKGVPMAPLPAVLVALAALAIALRRRR
ncbi:MAG TPA: fibronectin type III domain-containing protein [Candidatus Thermoplasmatota archaeon]|nr:fibronectin type III domain-containing protein [Candidatus Thermoplasmatota archaeon]